MTREERKAQFDRLFDSLPGRKVEKIRYIAGLLYCAENTVRIWQLREPTRVIPKGKLLILKDRIANP